MRRVCMFLVCFLGLAVVEASCAPTISVDNATYTVTVQSGSEVSHAFKLTNTGDETLLIRGVQASCGCTTTTLQKPELAPAESVELEARVNTTGFGGTVQKTVTVQSNDPVTPSLVLHMTLTITDAAPPAPVASTPTPAPVAPVSAEPSTQQPPAWPIVAGGAIGAVILLAAAVVAWRTHRRRRQS